MPSTTLIWFIAGLVLCCTEIFLPTAFIALLMGISALVVALLSSIVMFVWLQVVIWLLLSGALVLLSRRFVTKVKRKSKTYDATIAETMTEIPVGKTGRVLYEGNSWLARCDVEIAIPEHQRVYVIRREGTTLIIMPEHLLR
ncbi:NfeD family protein [Iningainema tapete]|uniref:NfeD family protein n=1 Tax=Iningainema tapete BLCC-T55 TaxID=2748662 RepID=A0A8J6XKB8_9CYAN|nr:NfeD family protein [Iningainema tapete]MBD2772416.1 NfeD family protein [Iningainema tapete BLCC-T55]